MKRTTSLKTKLKSVHRKPPTHTVSFARSIASSSVLNVFTQRTGPNTSSLQICIEVVTSVMTVGSTKNPLFRCCHWILEKISSPQELQKHVAKTYLQRKYNHTLGRDPPVKMVAPSLLAFEINFNIFSYWTIYNTSIRYHIAFLKKSVLILIRHFKLQNQKES